MAIASNSKQRDGEGNSSILDVLQPLLESLEQSQIELDIHGFALASAQLNVAIETLRADQALLLAQKDAQS